MKFLAWKAACDSKVGLMAFAFPELPGSLASIRRKHALDTYIGNPGRQFKPQALCRCFIHHQADPARTNCSADESQQPQVTEHGLETVCEALMGAKKFPGGTRLTIVIWTMNHSAFRQSLLQHVMHAEQVSQVLDI